MEFRELTTTEKARIQKIGVGSYQPILISKSGAWQVFVSRVMFGSRIAIMHADSSGPCIEYCCGENEELLRTVARAVIRIMETRLWEECSEGQLLKTMPPWSVRPIDKDEKCLPSLLELAYK